MPALVQLVATLPVADSKLGFLTTFGPGRRGVADGVEVDEVDEAVVEVAAAVADDEVNVTSVVGVGDVVEVVTGVLVEVVTEGTAEEDDATDLSMNTADMVS